jgi:hypothetical protein
MNRPPLSCHRCGCLAVRWMQTRAGKWYLANRDFEPTNPAYAAATARVPHKCANHTRHSIESEQHSANYYAAQGIA